MTERMNGLRRTDMCGTLSKRDEDREVIVTGFAAKTRDLGNLLFIDLRDRTGILQLAFDDETPQELFAKARGVRSEYVLCARGRVRLRTGKNVNPAMATGEVEIAVTELRILSEADVTPFVISEKAAVSETLALKYRYLDLRKPVFQRNLIMRDRICRAVRSYYAENGFLEIETPCLGKSTPEGARDYLVPSRVKPGTFYALPQSPQLYKQLLMIAGMDRYYQIARCFRDEDLRANRQPEFTQIDVEMSYVERDEDVMEIAEGMIKRIFSECRGISFDAPFRRMKWREAMDRFGSDKPDTRYGLEIRDLSPCVRNSSFVLFSRALERGTVRGICVPGAASRFSRKEMDAFSDFASDYGVSRILWTAKREDADASSFYKNLTPDEIKSIEKTLGAGRGDLILVAADAKTNSVLCALGALRRKLADALRLYDKSVYDVLWITDFPLLEWSDEDNRFYAQHHPFTSVHADDTDKLDSKDRDVLASIRANAYDIVINGQEAGGGSIRIHTPEMQRKMFSLLGLDDETVKNRFGFFLEAFRYGTPPHGGIAFGLDRLVMLLTGDENIKDVIAFPKVQNASDLMTGAPDAVEESQLKELDITLAER